MPKVYFNETDKQLDQMYDFLILECRRQKVRQKHIAAVLGVTQDAVSKMFNRRTLTLDAFAKIMGMLGKDITTCIQ